ncbi:MAG: hypothetical protein HY809_07140 [Nitrospirae bacterium]|nr:hypothetical protein [Nitrospirota bacterium]
MKKSILLKTSTAICSITLSFLISLFLVYDIAYAFDREGCLTCHQYSGLIKQEKGGGFKSLNIDEMKYMSSSHGKVDCKECHTGIKEIPHVGVSAINCTSGCHIPDKEKIERMKASSGKFHGKEKHMMTNIQNESSCGVCHLLYPHSKNKKTRAFLNMHTGYVVCEVCHLKKDKFTDLNYEWMDPEGVAFHGEPYGTYYNVDTGHVEESDEFITRIAVVHGSGKEKKMIFNKEDIARARAFLKNKTASAPETKAELDYFHRDIAKMEVSVACDKCHSPGGTLPFEKLGFSKQRITDLQYLNIKSLVTKYETFYLPNLFGN